MSNSKAVQIGKDIDNARCNGNWSTLPELIRRFKKHSSEAAVLEQTVLAEINLIQLLNNTRTTSIDYSHDDPYHITLEDRIDPNAVKAIQAQLLSAIQLADPNNVYTTQKEFAKIILARTWFESGEYQKVIEIISELSFEKDQVSQGYGFVLFLQAKAMKAMSFDLLENETDAISSYESIVLLLNENGSGRNNKLTIEWSEDTLYRAILFGVRPGSSASTSTLLDFMRLYQTVTHMQAVQWRIQKRMIVTRQSLGFCSQAYRSGQYSVPYVTEDPAQKQQFFIAEQSQLHTIYEKMLHSESPLPKAGQVNTRVLDFVNQFAHDFELIGTSAYDLRGFVEVLDRASQKTFNSSLITRHLFLALVRLGEFEEAEHALFSYLYLVGLVSHGWKETRHDGRALAVIAGVNVAVPEMRPDMEQEDEEMASIKASEREDVADTLHVIVTAIKMYSNDLRRGVDAVEMAEIGKQLYQKQSKQEGGARLYRAVGVAYGLLAQQTSDEDLRPEIHDKALGYLERSLQLDPEAWETYYQLALQQAEMRDIGHAAQAVTQAIKRHPQHIALWHLLTLLITCPAQGDVRKALTTCETGIQQAYMDGEQSNLWTSDEYEHVDQHMMYQLTRTILVHILQGPESALEASEMLFATVRKIAIPELSTSTQSDQRGAHDGMIVSGSLGNLSELTVEQRRQRGRSTSNAGLAGSQERTAGRARSTSHLSSAQSLSGAHSGQSLLTVPDDKPHHHLHGLHLFGSKNSSKVNKLEYGKNQDSTGNSSYQSLPTSPYDNLNISATSLQSVAPSIMSGVSLLKPASIPSKPSTRVLLRKERSDQVLSDLWLLTAQMFINLGKLDEARKAIEEAENVDWTNNAQVWCMLGRLLLAEGKDSEAHAAFQKALVVDPNDTKTRIELAKSYIKQNELELAEGILDSMTKSNAWNCAEAWFLLSEIYKSTNRLERTKACLFYALELESTTPVQPFSILPRYI